MRREGGTTPEASFGSPPKARQLDPVAPPLGSGEPAVAPCPFSWLCAVGPYVPPHVVSHAATASAQPLLEAPARRAKHHSAPHRSSVGQCRR